MTNRRRILPIAGLLVAGLLGACSPEASTVSNVGSTTTVPLPSATTTTATTATTAADTSPLKDQTERPQIWFGPLDPWSWDQHHPGAGPFQFYDLFSEGAAWQETADAVHVMRLYPIWLESYATLDQLRGVLADLGRRGIAVSFETGPLNETEVCNASTLEGFSGAGPARAVAERVRAAGGVLHSIDLEHGFDAATYYDHACRMTPTEIARDVTNTIEAVRSVFPEVTVGSIETADLDLDAVAAWLEAYRSVAGDELDYFHLDVDFQRPDWAARAREIEEHVRSRGVEFGIIYFGDAQDTTDEAWLSKAEQRMIEYEVINQGTPDHVVFQSWHRHPKRLLPESQPGTFTHLISRYLRARTVLTLESGTGTVAGSVVTAVGQPLVGTTVEIEVEPVSGPGLVAEHTLTGVVPQGVAHADVGYRINTECECSGPADLVVYEARYTEGASEINLVPNGDFGRGAESWGTWGSADYEFVSSDIGSGQALRVSAAPGADAGLNSGFLPVIPGAPFTITFTARISPQSAGSGYFQIIFHDATGERQRLTIPLAAGRLALGAAETGADGRFELPVDQEFDGHSVVRAWFPGDDRSWPALATTDR